VGQRAEELVDITLQDEIELVGDLVVAAAASAEHMSEDDIDRVLGIDGDDPSELGSRRRGHQEHKPT
jgi:hypothetical protein